MAVVALLALVAPLSAAPWAAAAAPQEAQQPQYTAEEYEAYQKAASAEPGAREDALLGFVKANPESALNQYALGEYAKLLQGYFEKADWPALATASDKLLTHDAKSVSALYMGTLAYFQQQKYDKAAELGEKLYAIQPTVERITYFLTMSYRALNNQEKYMLYGEKAMTELQPAEYYFMLPEFMRFYLQKKNDRQAADYAQKTIELLDKMERPASSPEDQWKDYVNREKGLAHAVLAKRAFDSQNWTQAINNYQRAMTLFSSNAALRGEALYHIGMSQWKQNRIDAAMATFAKGTAVKGAPPEVGKACRAYLEQLYKFTHNDSLAGIEEFIETNSR